MYMILLCAELCLNQELHYDVTFEPFFILKYLVYFCFFSG